MLAQDCSNKLWKNCPSSLCSYGYPDPDYLKRVEEELAAKGVQWADWCQEASHQLCQIVSSTDSTNLGMFYHLGWSWNSPEQRQSFSLVLPRASELGLWSMVLSGAAAAPLYLHVFTFRQKSLHGWPVFLIKMFISFQCLTPFKYSVSFWYNLLQLTNKWASNRECYKMVDLWPPFWKHMCILFAKMHNDTKL